MTPNRRRTDAPILGESIGWFHDNLELLVEDVRFEGQVDIYFDTQDLRAVVLGMYYFFDVKKGNFQWKTFRDKSDIILVHCLAAAGWLGKISMLAPHRAEFLGLLRNDFGLTSVGESPRQLARRFLREGFREIDAEGRFSSDVEVEDLEGLEGDKLVESFGGKAELAKEFFKLLQCIKGSWRTRLMAWDRYLALQEGHQSFDPVPYMKEDIFLRLKDQLDIARPDYTMNNISDALAVTCLVMQLRSFEEDPSHRRLPLLFDHGGDLQKAIRNAGVQDSLRYRGKSKSFSVLRDWRYFFLRATFGHQGKDPHGEEELGKILRAVEDIRRASKRMTQETFGALGPPVSNIDQLIEYMKEFGFFGKVWLGSWKDDLGRVIEELGKAKLLERDQIATVEGLQTDEVREKFEEAKETVEQNFRQSAGLYHGIIDLLRAIDRRARKILRGLTVRNRDESDIVLILGSFRFPFSSSVHNDTASVLSDLASRDTERRLDAQAKVITALSESRAGESLSYTTLTLLLGVLWATELDQEILDLAEGQQHLFPGTEKSSWTEATLAFSLVWLAAVVRLTFGEEEKRYSAADPESKALLGEKKKDSVPIRRSSELRSALAVLSRIEVFCEDKKGDEKARIAVSLAYIQFHIFTSLCPARSARWPSDIPSKTPSEFLKSAMHYAEIASETSTLDEKRRIYALNQFLYYIAEGIRRNAESFQRLEVQFDDAAQRLSTFENGEGWHYRYDDSLARYYEIVGQERNDRSAWERGRIHIEKAVKDCFDDPVILDYYKSFCKRQEDWEAKLHEKENW